MLTDVEILLNDTYNILIILDLASRASRTDSIARSIVRSNGPATISSPFSGAGALRVVYAPKACISLFFLGRIGSFQWVTGKKIKKPGCAQLARRVVTRSFFLFLFRRCREEKYIAQRSDYRKRLCRNFYWRETGPTGLPATAWDASRARHEALRRAGASCVYPRKSFTSRLLKKVSVPTSAP
jgi:hypothetical protein